MNTKIIMDCDPGIDDAFSIAMAVASDEIDVLGITTTYGNVGLNHTTNNTLRILDWLGSNIPVYKGVDRALLGPTVEASEYHGASGLEAPEMIDPSSLPMEENAVTFLIDTLMSSSSKVTIVASGPLTNLAIMLRMAPFVTDKIERIVFMGGSTDYGNDSPAAEFNMLCDPLSAQIVLDTHVPKTMFGLNVTHKVIATPSRVQAMRDIGNDAGRVYADMSIFFEKIYRDRYGFNGSALHDPCTIAWLLQPELFLTQNMRVDVETDSGLSYGRTVHDIWNLSGKERLTNVAMDVNADGFFELLNSRLAMLR